MKRLAALIEVLVAFAAMHVAFRAVMKLTPPGRLDMQSGTNFVPGLVMIAVALAAISIRRGSLRRHGITARPFLQSVNAALVLLAILCGVGGVALALGLPLRPASASRYMVLLVAALQLGATLLLLAVLRGLRGRIDRLPPAVTIVAIALPAVLPLALAGLAGRPIGSVALMVLWIIIAGVGEEIFFRGYIQSRLNEAFGRPWSLLGVPFGPGLLIAAALFGLVHALNTTDYFNSIWQLDWRHGIITATTLYYGFLRERTGSIVAPACAHVGINLLARAAVMA